MFAKRSSPFAISLASMFAVLATTATVVAQTEAPSVVADKVTEVTVHSEQTFVGTIMPVRHSVVGSAVSGRVDEFFVNEGDFVKKNQPLAQLKTEAISIEVAAAAADRDLRKYELDEMQNGSRPEEVEQAKAKMLAAKAIRDYRQSRYKRLTELAERRASSADELQDAASAAEAASNEYLDAKNAWSLSVAGPRKEKVLQAKARYLTAVEEVKRLEDQLRKHTMVSPFDGYVTVEHTEIGQWISAGELVAEVVELGEVDVEVAVLGNYIPNLQLGMEARVEVGAIPNEALIGQIAAIVPQADIKSRTFPVKVRLANEVVGGTPRLKPGMFSRVTFAVGKPEVATLVHKDALVLGGPRPVVWVVDGAGSSAKVRQVEVALGVVSAERVQVKGEIKAGQLVVIQGNERHRAGQAVSVINSKTQPNSTPAQGKPTNSTARR